MIRIEIYPFLSKMSFGISYALSFTEFSHNL